MIPVLGVEYVIDVPVPVNNPGETIEAVEMLVA